MIIVPGLPPLHQTRHARELARRVEQAVRDYQRDNPDVTESEVRTALLQSAAGGESLEGMRRKRVLRIVVAVLMAGVFALVASTGGGRFGEGNAVWQVVGVIGAVIAVAITAIRFASRN